MEPLVNLDVIAESIATLRRAADELSRLGDAFPAVAKNAARIQASVKMLELNVTDWRAVAGDATALEP